MLCGQIKERRTVKRGGGISAEELRTFLHDTADDCDECTATLLTFMLAVHMVIIAEIEQFQWLCQKLNLPSGSSNSNSMIISSYAHAF